MEYWDSKGQIYNDKQTVLSPLERAYNKIIPYYRLFSTVTNQPELATCKRELINKEKI